MATTLRQKAVGMIRVSTAAQADEGHYGVPAQQEAIKKIAKQYNLDLVEVISYNDVSGTEVMFSAPMKRMLKLIQRPDITAVVAKEFSRIIRPKPADMILLDRFRENDIIVYIESGPIDVKKPIDEFNVGVRGLVDKLELHTLLKRSMDGKEEGRRDGASVSGSNTLPSIVLWDKKTHTWAYDDVVAPKVREAGLMLIAGTHSLQTIITTLHLRLKKRGVLSTRLTDPSALRRLLRNPICKGVKIWADKLDPRITREHLRYVDPKDGEMKYHSHPRITRKDDDVIPPRQVITPGLFSPEEFKSITDILDAKSTAKHQVHDLTNPSTNYAGGMLYCECGEPLWVWASGKHGGGCRRYYVCRTQKNRFRKDAVARCQSKPMRAVDLDVALDTFFTTRFADPEFLKELLSGYEERNASDGQAHRKESMLARIQKLAAKRDAVIDDRQEGTITKAERDVKLKTINAEADSLRTLVDSIRDTPKLTPEGLVELFEPLYCFDLLHRDDKRMLLTALFQQITVRDYDVTSFVLLPGARFEPAFTEAHKNARKRGRVERDSKPRCSPRPTVTLVPQRAFISLKPKARDAVKPYQVHTSKFPMLVPPKV
jgi:DNA invertase Pin-like site-specific DNA recombinase